MEKLESTTIKITPLRSRKPSKKTAAPTEMRIQVRNLTFDTPYNAEDGEAPKYFVLISFDGSNFMTAKKSIDVPTNSPH